MNKIITAAVREFRVTALTWAFLIGAVIAPAAIWGLIIVLTASGVLAQERDPLVGTIAVVDATDGQSAAAGIEAVFDPEFQAELRRRQIEQEQALIESSPIAQAIPPDQLAQAQAMAAQFAGSARDTDITIETLDADLSEDEIAAQKQRVLDGELLALIVLGAYTVALPLAEIAEDTIEAAAAAARAHTPDDAPATEPRALAAARSAGCSAR